MGGFAKTERSHKLRKTGVPGIVITMYKHPKKNIWEYHFQVRVPRFPIRSIYIGTENTWIANAEEKFEISKSIWNGYKNDKS